VLRPGTAAVSTEKVSDLFEDFEVDGGDDARRPIGRMELRTRVVVIDGTPFIVRTEAIWMDEELVQVDSFTLQRSTLAPRSLHSASAESSVRLEFTTDAVRRVEAGDWGADTADVPLPGPVFLAGTTDLLLGSLPLRPGYSASLAVYDAQDGFDTLTVEVEVMEEVPLPSGGSISTWRVGVTEGSRVSTYWMDRESRRLVQFESADGGIRIVRSRASRSRARPTR
jgi:hypothetical protein